MDHQPQQSSATPHAHHPSGQLSHTRTPRLPVLGLLVLVMSMLLACSGPEASDGLDPTSTAGGAPSASAATTNVPGSTAPAEQTQTGGVDPTSTTPDGAATVPVGPDATAPVTVPPTATTTPAEPTATSTTTPPPATPWDPSQASIALEQVGTGFDQPSFVTEIPDGSGRLIVLEKTGALRLMDGTMFLNIRERVVQTGFDGYEHEQGMLGVAFHPNYARNGEFFVHYNDTSGGHVISRFRAGADGLGDPNSEAALMTYPQPEVNFQGGGLVFGRDGYLYIGTGTGGTAVELQLQAQSLDNIYGKILRIDVNSTGPNGEAYGIPADNPFVSTPGARAEIWAYGLRNPWRFSFDRATNDLYSGGPGQFTREWINVQRADVPAGQNHGWPIYEGLVCWADWTAPCVADGLLLPVIDFPTYEDGNCVIIGGYVARDAAPASVHGAYVFGDFCSGRIFATGQGADGIWLDRTELASVGGYISSFGEDMAGNVYVTVIDTGVVYRLVQG